MFCPSSCADPATRVAAWVSAQQLELLFTASICQAEILAGIAILPAGRRRSDLEAAARAMFADDFEGRILAFDMPAAEIYADLFAARRRAGRPGTTFDLMMRRLRACVVQGS